MSTRRRLFVRRRLPLTLQAEAAECGIACLAMIATYHGHEINLNEIRHRFRISLKGTTLSDLVTFAEEMGLSARGLRLEPPALGKLVCPAILHLDMNHFVVLKEMRGTVAIVHDPAYGVRKFDAEELHRRFTGIALELTPTAEFEPREGEPSTTLSSLVGEIPSGGLLAKTLGLSFILQIFVLLPRFTCSLSSIGPSHPGTRPSCCRSCWDFAFHPVARRRRRSAHLCAPRL